MCVLALLHQCQIPLHRPILVMMWAAVMCSWLKQQRWIPTTHVADWTDEEALILSKSSLAACALQILRFREQAELQDAEVEMGVVSSPWEVSLALIFAVEFLKRELLRRFCCSKSKLLALCLSQGSFGPFLSWCEFSADSMSQAYMEWEFHRACVDFVDQASSLLQCHLWPVLNFLSFICICKKFQSAGFLSATGGLSSCGISSHLLWAKGMCVHILDVWLSLSAAVCWVRKTGWWDCPCKPGGSCSYEWDFELAALLLSKHSQK